MHRNESAVTTGAFMLGGTDRQYYTGNIYYTPVTTRGFGQFTVDRRD